MRRRVVAGAVVLAALGLLAWWALAPAPSASFQMAVAGKGNVTYTCTVTSTRAEAESRAKSAHAAFLAGLQQFAAAIAPRMQDAMVAASTSGDRAALEAAQADFKAQVVELRAGLVTQYGCNVDSTLLP